MADTDNSKDLRKRIAKLENRISALEAGQSNSSRPDYDLSECFDITNIDGRVIGADEDAGVIRFSWKVAIQSLIDSPLQVDLGIQFVDMNSFVVVEERVRNLQLRGQKLEKFTGLISLSPEEEHEILGVKAWLKHPE